MSELRIALAGNPNCGKTTLFNALTASNGYVGNWPGVTVEKKEAKLKGDDSTLIVDLPGIYSLSPYSPEEVVSRDFLINDRPDVVINVIDATNLERNLYLTTQILETGLPVVVALNMCDIMKQSGITIDVEKFSEILGVPCVQISALKEENLDGLLAVAKKRAQTKDIPVCPCIFGACVEQVIQQIIERISDRCPHHLLRWCAVRIFEGDDSIKDKLTLTDEDRTVFAPQIARVEAEMDEDPESLIASMRYEWISGLISQATVRSTPAKSMTEKIDCIVTNRWLGLPIFIVIMGLVYYIAVATVGDAATTWANDGVFGDGWHLFGIGAAEYKSAHEAYASGHYPEKIEAYLGAAEEAKLPSAAEAAAAYADEDTEPEARQALLEKVAEEGEASGLVAHNVALKDEDGNFLDTEEEPVQSEVKDGEVSPVLADGQHLLTEDVSGKDFAEAISAEEPDPSAYGVWVPGIPGLVEAPLDQMGASDLTKSLVLDGIVAGVGSILGFLPQMILLFIMLCFLEDCGYMSRVAFVMDRVFRRFGLSGKSFIPMLISSGCGVPGIMATKTIESEADRRMTIITTSMIPCGAKLPIIALLMGALAGGSAWWVAPLFYFLGVLAIVISGIMLKKTRPFAGDPTPFVMELPAYHMPALRSWFLHVWERVGAFVKKAGTVIFLASVLIWFLSSFGWAELDGVSHFGWLPSFDLGENFMDHSLLAAFGSAIAWIFAPLGFARWEAVASTVSALIAKENLVSTYGVLFQLGEVGENSTALWSSFAQMFSVNGAIHVGSMLAFVAFNLLCAPCFAAMGAMRKQMASTRWWLFGIAYMCVFGWVVGLMINQAYEFIVFGNLGIWSFIALAIFVAMLVQIVRPMPRFDDLPAQAA